MNPIRIGTRTSTLAMWQANKVSDTLIESGYSTEIVGISSQGDQSLNRVRLEPHRQIMCAQAVPQKYKKKLETNQRCMDLPQRLPNVNMPKSRFEFLHERRLTSSASDPIPSGQWQACELTGSQLRFPKPKVDLRAWRG